MSADLAERLSFAWQLEPIAESEEQRWRAVDATAGLLYAAVETELAAP